MGSKKSREDDDKPTLKKGSKPNQNKKLETKPQSPTFVAIPDQYETLDQVQEALRKAGLESSNCIFYFII